MRRSTAHTIAVLGIVLGAAAPAWADLCLTVPQGTYVGRGFNVPRRNKCRSFIGFRRGSRDGVSGVGCTTADGSRLSLSYTRSGEPANREIGSVDLLLPQLTGSVTYHFIFGTGVTLQSGPASAVRCRNDDIP